MARAKPPVVKAACLSCRSSKTRCDGKQPCGSCASRERDCSYQPSRRGGVRRGTRYAEEQRRRLEPKNLLSSFSPSSPPEITKSLDSALDRVMCLVSPFAGLHNLDFSSDSLLDTIGGGNFWEQFTPSTEGPHNSVSAADVEQPIARAYQSEADIANAYYIYIHQYLPLLPPSTEPKRKDSYGLARLSVGSTEPQKADLHYWPKSSLGLALSAILVLIPPSQNSSPMTEANVALRRSYAHMFAQAALASAENEIDRIGPISSLGVALPQERSHVHPLVPFQLDPILTLVVLTIYEYCQRGNVSRMRARINQAVTTAMDMSLHELGLTTTEYSEAQRRAWWMTMFVSYQSSNLHLAPPVITAEDQRITTPFPQFDMHLEPWCFIIRVQKALYECNQMARRPERVTETVPPRDMSTEIRNLDNQVVSLMTESDRYLRTGFDQGNETLVAENMWRISRILIYTARIRLHRSKAFMDIPLFLDKYCDLTSINSHDFSHHIATRSVSRGIERDISFPFTEQESSHICLKASLVVAKGFRDLVHPSAFGGDTSEGDLLSSKDMFSDLGDYKYPHSIPYFSCSAMQSSYALLMLVRKLRSSLATDRLGACYHLLNKPEPATEASDTERLIEELRHGVELLSVSLEPDVVFEGVGRMGHEIKSAYVAAFSDYIGI